MYSTLAQNLFSLENSYLQISSLLKPRQKPQTLDHTPLNTKFQTWTDGSEAEEALGQAPVERQGDFDVCRWERDPLSASSVVEPCRQEEDENDRGVFEYYLGRSRGSNRECLVGLPRKVRSVLYPFQKSCSSHVLDLGNEDANFMTYTPGSRWDLFHPRNCLLEDPEKEWVDDSVPGSATSRIWWQVDQRPSISS